MAQGGTVGPVAARPADGREERIATDLRARAGEQVREVERFGDGHSGFTYRVALAGGHSWLLRLAPPGARAAGPADVGRQGAIMAALHEQGMPVPRVLDYDSGPAIDGRSFALMEMVEGDGWEEAVRAHSPAHVADRAVGALATLQGIAPARVLADEPAGSAMHELERWAGLARRADEDGLGDVTGRLAAALGAAAPSATTPVLVHGDYHYGNLIFRDGEVVAVIDWEIATVGEPYADLAGLMVASLRARYLPEPNPTGTIDVPFDTLCERYGAPLDSMRWWVAETCLKYSAILRYNRMLHRRGKRIDPIYDQLDRTASGLIDDGRAILEGGFAAAPARGDH